MGELFKNEALNEVGLYRLLQKPSPEFQNILFKNFKTALSQIEIPQSPNSSALPEVPLWRDIHQANFQHLSELAQYAVKPISTVGDKHTVNVGTSDWIDKKLIQTAGPSERLIVELSKPPQVYVVLAGSNQDIEKPNLSEPQGPWMKWARCQEQKKEFPLDWTHIPAKDIRL